MLASKKQVTIMSLKFFSINIVRDIPLVFTGECSIISKRLYLCVDTSGKSSSIAAGMRYGTHNNLVIRLSPISLLSMQSHATPRNVRRYWRSWVKTWIEGQKSRQMTQWRLSANLRYCMRKNDLEALCSVCCICFRIDAHWFLALSDPDLQWQDM
jgi:hypothetical protein